MYQANLESKLALHQGLHDFLCEVMELSSLDIQNLQQMDFYGMGTTKSKKTDKRKAKRNPQTQRAYSATQTTNRMWESLIKPE